MIHECDSYVVWRWSLYDYEVLDGVGPYRTAGVEMDARCCTMLVTCLPWRPQGTMWSNPDMLQETLMEKPCIVIHLRAAMQGTQSGWEQARESDCILNHEDEAHQSNKILCV